jgi:Domain of unknown function (DUF2760)
MIGFGQRVSFAFRSFFRILSSGEIPRDVAQELVQPEAEVAQPSVAAPALQAGAASEGVDRVVQMLAILQRDGRLIDFFTEDIGPYSDAQIGAAVRDLHESCKKSLERYVKFEPIIESDEGQPVTVEDPVDLTAVKLIGNVTGKPPLRGLLRHKGWRVKSVDLPPLPEEKGRSVVAPAEVEI